MIFIDTSWFYAAEVEADVHHEEAGVAKSNLARGAYGTPYTTNYVLDETITLLRYRASLTAALAFKRKVEASTVLRTIWVTEEIAKQANELLEAHKQLELSFTDCTSLVVMKALGIEKALTFDQDFEKAGFTPV